MLILFLFIYIFEEQTTTFKKWHQIRIFIEPPNPYVS